MAESGAKVINAQAVEWARRQKITLVARKTSDGEHGKETLAREDTAARARAVVAMDRVVLAEAASTESSRVIDALAATDVPVIDVVIQGERATCIIPLLNVPDWDKRRTHIGSFTLTEGLSLVSVVGDGLGTASALAQFAGALAAQKIVPKVVRGSPLRIAAVVEAEGVSQLQKALHAAFVA
jgi:aspartate kinase